MTLGPSDCSSHAYELSFLVHLFSINPSNFACLVSGGQRVCAILQFGRVAAAFFCMEPTI